MLWELKQSATLYKESNDNKQLAKRLTKCITVFFFYALVLCSPRKIPQNYGLYFRTFAYFKYTMSRNSNKNYQHKNQNKVY